MNNIMIVGVGGQGTLLASRIIGNTMMKRGLEVKVSEVHGMSQRGGSVVTYVRCGREVWSPLIEKGEADVIIAFEQLEAARWLPYLKPGGKMVVSSQKMMPMPVITGAAEYPGELAEKIAAADTDIEILDALSLAVEAGSPRAVNVVLIGALARSSDIPRELWEEALRETVPPKFLEMNIKAFELGYSRAVGV